MEKKNMSELKIITEKRIDPDKDDIQLMVNGELVNMKIMDVLTQETTLEEELKEAYIALKEDRKELNTDWDRTTGEKWD
jgi:hypothetical protein